MDKVWIIDHDGDKYWTADRERAIREWIECGASVVEIDPLTKTLSEFVGMESEPRLEPLAPLPDWQE